MAHKNGAPVRVLGVDPGTRRLGFGIIERRGSRMVAIAHGVIDVSSEPDFLARLVRLSRELRAVIDQHKPSVAAIEQVFAGRNVKTAIRAAEGRGAVLLTLANAGLPVTEYAARSIKQAVTGKGSAAKAQVGMMIQTLLGLKALPAEDASDALAVAICHLQRTSTHPEVQSNTGASQLHRIVPDPREVLARLMSSRKSSRGRVSARQLMARKSGT